MGAPNNPFILFKSDFDRMHATIHFTTKNTSALRLAQVYKKMGIKFWYPHLSLLNRELADLDPFSTTLTLQQKAAIVMEAKLNPWYFLRECLRLPVAGGVLTPYIFFFCIIASAWTFFADIDFGLVLPRQCGKSFCTQTLVCYMLYILGDRVHMAHVDKSSENCINCIRTVKDIRASMPQWMWQRSGGDVENRESLAYGNKHNIYSTFPASVDKVAAGNMCRGLSLSVLHFDEIAYTRFNWISVPAAIAAKLNAATVARSQGLPAPTIYTTTAGNPDTEVGRYALSIFEDAMPFTESVFDLKDRDELISVIDKSAPKRRIFIEFSYLQLGKTEEWFRQASAELNGNDDDIARDLLNIWQSSSDANVIPQSIITKLRKSKEEPQFVDLSRGFAMRWYVPESEVNSPEFRQRPLVGGMDTSENIGRDFTTLVILDPRDMSVVAVCRCNDSNTMQVARYIYDLLQTFTGLVWVPERNNTGIAIIDYVIDQMQNKNQNPFLRIYNEVIQNYGDPKYEKVNIYDYQEIHGHTRASFGYRTSGGSVGGTSRNQLYKVIMMKNLEMNAARIKDNTLINEYCNLTVRNGRIDHKEGLHDDTIIGHLLSCFLIFFGKNLSMYGIPEGTVLERVNVEGDVVTNTARNEQIEIKRRIAELEDAVNNCNSHLLKQSYLRELNGLRPLLDEKMVAVTPIAVSQVQHEEKVINNRPGSAENKLHNFVSRLTNTYR